MAPVYKFSSARSLVGPNTYYSSVLAGNSVFRPIPPSAYALLETEILTDPLTSVTFSNLDVLAAGYQHLQIRAVLRSNRAGDTSSRAGITFNSDGGANYINHYMGTTGTSNFSSYLSQYTTKMISVDGVVGSTGTANTFGGVIFDILDPFETNKFKTMRFIDGQAQAFNRVSLNTGVWKSTNAVTSITINDEYASFIPGTRISLYGLKAA